MNNKSAGVLFNDNSKIVLDPNCFNFYFSEKSERDLEMHSFSNFPPALNKKVTLLSFFAFNYLGFSKKEREEQKAQGWCAFVKSWKRTDQAIFMQFNSRVT